MIAALLLLVSVGALLWFARDDVAAYTRFKAIETSAARQRTFLRWTAQGLGLFTALPLAGLALLGRLDTIAHFPAAFAPWRPDLHDIDAEFLGGFGAAMVGAMLVGGVIGGLIAARRKRPASLPGLDLDAMMPRSAARPAASRCSPRKPRSARNYASACICLCCSPSSACRCGSG